MVRDGYEHFYILDYDGALSRFESVLKAHPQDPMAYGYVQMATVFRELYHQDLLDTTYYAHDSFLTFEAQRGGGGSDAAAHREPDRSRASSCATTQIKANPNDKDAYFARGYLRGIHAAFITLVDHSFVAAARQGYAARGDSEQALKIDPEYADAKMAIGIQLFAVASLPRWVRMLVGIVGVGGNKEKGLTDAAGIGRAWGDDVGGITHGVVAVSAARWALSGGAGGAAWAGGAVSAQLSVSAGRGQPDQGRGQRAGCDRTVQGVLADAAKPGYFVDPRLQMALFGLADTQRGQNDIAEAAENYVKAAEQPKCSDWLRKRAQLNAGRDVRPAAPARASGAFLQTGVGRRWGPVAGGRGAAVFADSVQREVAGANGEPEGSGVRIGVWECGKMELPGGFECIALIAENRWIRRPDSARRAVRLRSQ